VPWFERRRDWLGPPHRKQPSRKAKAPAQPPGIVIRSPRCPGCRSRQFRTTKTVRQPRWTVRYHVCTGCGLHFKSIEPEDEK